MLQEDRIYCVCCHDVMPTEQAASVFRTGYYKSSMRLGLCSTCSVAEAPAAVIADEALLIADDRHA